MCVGVEGNSFCFVSFNTHQGQTAKLKRVRKRRREQEANSSKKIVINRKNKNRSIK